MPAFTDQKRRVRYWPKCSVSERHVEPQYKEILIILILSHTMTLSHHCYCISISDDWPAVSDCMSALTSS